MRIVFTICFFFSICLLFAQQSVTFSTPFEMDPKSSATYAETIGFYELLDRQYEPVKMLEAGPTDSGRPLHLVILSTDGDFDPVSIRSKGKRILFILNAIHPGEPCGVDASMLLYKELVEDHTYQDLLREVVIVTVPFYNIGGGLNRGSFSRANQDGPKAYGFRGNAKNLDLNRDFIKCDSRNAQSLNQAFARWQPDIFIDTHTSNGADYTYTMTYVAPQKDKLSPPLSRYLTKVFLPEINASMKQSGWEMTPYVYARNSPDGGIYGFLDLPRYSSGYAALHQTLGIMSETHMLKPFEDRVRSTYYFLLHTLELLSKDAVRIGQLRKNALMAAASQKQFDLKWQRDNTKVDSLLFKGYEAKFKPSPVSGKDRLYYDQSAPYEKNVPYFNTFKSSLTVEAPVAYILPQAYREVADRLRWNGVQMDQLKEDLTLEVEQYYIRKFETTDRPYEGHYLHSDVEVEKVVRKTRFQEGDWVIFVDQPVNRYIVETLEPQAPDSYFAWNFFDGILMQKEYFSSYVFEDVAAKLLEQDPVLRNQLEARKRQDAEFAGSARAQLDFIYRHSPYYEPTHNLYPVGRLMRAVKLPLKIDN